MPDAVALHQLVGAVAGAIVDAQALVEQRFIQQVSGYFDSEGKPLCLAIKMPRPGSASTDEMQIGLPLLSLAESSMLAIKDLRIELDVELGSVIDGPGAGAALAPAAAADPGAPAPGPAAAPSRFRTAGAPIDIPAHRAAMPPEAAASIPAPAAAPGPAAPVLPEKQLTLSVGTASATGPKARLSINVAAKPPSEAMLRLMTQLNKLV